jgi:predicted transcriptional regulator
MPAIENVTKGLVVPASVQHRAGIKSGDRVRFQVSKDTITIIALREPTYKPTRAELAAIRRGEAELARGQHVTLPELLPELDPPHSEIRAKGTRRASR